MKKNVRLEFVCGARAVRRARADLDLLSRLAGHFSAAAVELPALVEAQRAELKAAVDARRELEESLARYRARELYDAVPDGAPRRIVVREEKGPIERLRPLGQAVAAMPRALFVGWTADAAGDRRRRVGGLGGGRRRDAQVGAGLRWADGAAGTRGWRRALRHPPLRWSRW